MTIQEQIQNGESRTLEYKSELPQDSQKWIKTIIAFANGAGGKFVIGVNNKREFVGIPKSVDLFELKDTIADTIAQMCEPQVMFDITAEMVGNSQLLTVQVFPGNATPYYIKSLGKENGTFIRLGATTRNADWTTLDELTNRGRHVSYDELAYSSLAVDEADIAYLCKDFSERAKREITRKDLENLNVLTGNKKDVATNAYAILLGKHEYTSRIQCARFRGKERVDFLDKKEYEGSLCEQIDGAYKFVLNYLSMAVEINGIVHDERYELPPKAIRELIINAVIHRNYQMSSSVQVAVYDDRVEISSPGSLYGTLTLEEALHGRSSIRNITLARVLEKIDVVEGWGSGFKRIKMQCEEYGVAFPEFTEIGDMFRVNFYRPSYAKIGDKSAINAKIGDKSAINAEIGDKSAINYKERILTYLQVHTDAKSQEIALHIGLKLSRTKDYLSELAEDGKIVPNGANKNRTYSLKPN
ncbi:MAG: putative DNA binding domain-containing protein [Treponema sp.]|nr:putative DNA binding domain-containing protein [Treponema sp.]